MKRKQMTLTAFALGAAIFTSAAAADVIIGSGYNRLKDATKTTAAYLTNEADSFSYNVQYTLLLDGTVYMEEKVSAKLDVVGEKTESTTYSSGISRYEPHEYYSYRDSEKTISGNNGEYYVSEPYRYAYSGDFVRNPFDEKEAADIENIIDAFVGNLKDLVMIEEGSGNTVYSGNLSETQVPALANALTSFVVKYSIMDNYQTERLKEKGLPSFSNNIFVQSCGGKVIQNADGILENGVANTVITGEDENGGSHTLEFQIMADIFDINSTVVTEPQLDGEIVHYNTLEKNPILSEKYIGVYKSSIIDDTGDSFVKLGERILELTSVTDDSVIGKFYTTVHEEGTPEYFEFTAKPISPHELSFEYITSDGKTRTCRIYSGGSMNHNLHLNFDIMMSEESSGSAEQTVVIQVDSSSMANGLYIREFE